SAIDQWKATNIALPMAHRNVGNTPRAVGALLAEAEGYDFISFLDGDNWYRQNHLSSLIRIHEATKASVCCSWRTFHRLDGTIISNLQEDEELAFQHVDTSCYFVHRVIAHPRGWLVQAGRGIGFAWRVRRMASMARIERRRAVSTTERMSA